MSEEEFHGDIEPVKALAKKLYACTGDGLVGLKLVTDFRVRRKYQWHWVFKKEENMRHFRTAALAACLLCTACMTAGTQVGPGQLAQFQKGKTTEREIVSALGEPNSKSVTSDGTSVICYTYVHAAARPETFIPLVGAFVGADSRSDSTCFQFSQGVLESSSTNTSKFTSGTMLVSTHSDRH